MMRGHRTLLATIAAAGLLASCGGDAVSVTTDDEARQAVVDTFRNSWNAEIRVDIDLTDDQIAALTEAMAEAEGMDGTDQEAIQQTFDMLRTQAENGRTVMARADDGSFRFAAMDGEQTSYDVRLDIGDLVAMDTLTSEVSVVAMVDIEGMLEQLRESFEQMADVDPSMPSMAPELPDLTQLRAQAKLLMPSGPTEDMVLAIMDGEYGGVTGRMDLAEFGVTQDDLDQARDEFWGELEEIPFDVDDLAGAFGEAFSISDFTAADGGTRATVNVHPRATVVAIGEMAEAAGEVDDWRQDFADDTDMSLDDIPETVPAVATLLFDGDGNLHELTLPVVEIARQVVEVLDDAPPEATELLAELDGARYQMVMSLTDVGAVDTVLDIDAATVTWQELVETLEGFGMSPTASAAGTASLEVDPAAGHGVTLALRVPGPGSRARSRRPR